MIDDAGEIAAVGGLDLVVDQDRDHRRARGPGVDRDVKAVLLEQAAFLGDVELREGRIDAGGDRHLGQLGIGAHGAREQKSGGGEKCSHDVLLK